MGRKFMISMMLVWVLAIAACAALDSLFMPMDQLGGRSRAEAYGKPIAQAGGPWGEIALAGVMLLQNMYLGGRKIQMQIQKKRANGAQNPANA